MNMNYYELLGVNQKASEEEIKEAYKKLMKKWHPDINKDDNAVNMSSKINEAKEILLDSEKRKDYDLYLTKKTEENYNRYTQRKANENKVNNMQKPKTVTKWEYLNDWLKYANYSSFRKFIAVIGVLLETILCYIIKLFIISFAFICNILSYFIQMLFLYIYPIVIIIALLFIGQCMTLGFKNVLTNSPEEVKAIIIMIVLFVSSFILPILSKLILSPKVFEFLYNKIDVGLFKKCVGYNN